MSMSVLIDFCAVAFDFINVLSLGRNIKKTNNFRTFIITWSFILCSDTDDFSQKADCTIGLFKEILFNCCTCSSNLSRMFPFLKKC